MTESHLRLEQVDSSSLLANQALGWEAAVLPTDVLQELGVWIITAAPRGKHDFAMCPVYEKAWRQIFPRVVELLIPVGRQCLLFVDGPMEPNGLPRVFPHMYFGSESESPFHVEGVTFMERAGFVTTWMTFMFSRDSCSEMLNDDRVDLEDNRLHALIAEESALRSVISTPIWKLSPRWIIAHDSIVVVPDGHFEGCRAVGRKATVDAAAESIARSLDVL